MNDGLNNISDIADNTNDLAVDGQAQPDFSSTESETDMLLPSDSVDNSILAGDDHQADLPSDSDVVPPDSAVDSPVLGENSDMVQDLEASSSETVSGDTLESDVGSDSNNVQMDAIQDSISQLEHKIDSLADQTFTVTVSGNELTTVMVDNQKELMSNQLAIISITSCLLLAVLFDIMSRAAKRIVKGLVNNE